MLAGYNKNARWRECLYLMLGVSTATMFCAQTFSGKICPVYLFPCSNSGIYSTFAAISFIYYRIIFLFIDEQLGWFSVISNKVQMSNKGAGKLQSKPAFLPYLFKSFSRLLPTQTKK